MYMSDNMFTNMPCQNYLKKIAVNNIAHAKIGVNKF